MAASPALAYKPGSLTDFLSKSTANLTETELKGSAVASLFSEENKLLLKTFEQAKTVRKGTPISNPSKAAAVEEAKKGLFVFFEF